MKIQSKIKAGSHKTTPGCVTDGSFPGWNPAYPTQHCTPRSGH
jgi:hypothetical protein